MSFRTIQAVLDHSTLPPSEKFLLVLIANSENEKTGQCNPSKYVLAFYHNTSERNLRKLVNVIVGAGELVISGRAGRSNNYIIPLYPNEPGFYDPGPCQDFNEHKCNGHHGPLISRTEIAMQDNPRWQAQESRKQETQQTKRRTRKGGTGVPVSSDAGAELEFRGGGTGVPGGRNWSSGGAELEFPQKHKETGNETEGNLSGAPSITNWLSLPENRALRNARYAEKITAYDAWCAAHGLEPVR